MRRIAGHVCASWREDDGSFTVRLARLGAGEIVLVRVDEEQLADPQNLPLVFPTGATVQFNGQFRGARGFHAYSFAVAPLFAQAA